MSKVLKFKIDSTFGHFRQFNTTSSPMTYTIPPKPTIQGIIGAMLGLSKKEYLEKLKDVMIGIQLTKIPRKMFFTINTIDTKRGYLFPLDVGSRTPIRYQYLRNPEYIIYVHIPDEELHNELKRRLEEHRSVYPPFLGTTECIANFKFLGEYDLIESSDKIVSSVVRTIDWENNKGMIEVEEYQHFIMKPGRIPIRFGTVYYGKNIATRDNVYKIGDEKVAMWQD